MKYANQFKAQAYELALSFFPESGAFSIYEAQKLDHALDKAYNRMDGHRAPWGKPFLYAIANIGLALASFFLIPVGNYIVTGSCSFFTPKTKRQDLVNEMKESVASLKN